MKTYPNIRPSKGFTLVELLVVITIIAVLAAMSFAGVNVAIRKARKTQGTFAATALASSVNAFYTDYNRLPDLDSRLRTDNGQGIQLLEIVLGQEQQSDTMQNSKSNIYLNLPPAKAKKGGLYYGANNATIQALYDPFGKPYTVILNTEYDDVLTFSFGGKQYRLRNEQVAVYSAGNDGEEGTVDDITSWKK